MTTEEFIIKAKEVHGDKYDYSKCVYTKMKEKICVICPKHGEFWQCAYVHLKGHGCKRCVSESKSLTLDEFIKRCRTTHGDKYDYSKVNYVNSQTKVCIICPEHGEFWQTPDGHLRSKGCPMCVKEDKGYTTEKFIKCAQKVHGNKYDYSKVEYVDNQTKICIVCPEHGEFWQLAGSHLKGHGCKKCAIDKHRLTTSEFIERAMGIHGDEYDYTKTEYIDSDTPLCVTCRKHGDFYVLPHSHLDGQKCKICSGEEVTTETFIEKAKKVHDNKYDYSKVEYVNNQTKVCIICHEKDTITGKEHGEFWQTPNNHLNGCGCPSCACNKRVTFDDFIERSKGIHGDKYDYSKVNYVNADTKVCIICPEHGEFWQTPGMHSKGAECPKCAHQSYPDTTETFINKARKVHADKYDYSKVDYKNSHTKVCIVCPEHGEFYIIPTNHLRGKGCPTCAAIKIGLNNRLTTNEFIARAKKVHGDKYDYSKTNYEGYDSKICIICPEHGEFWQTAGSHLIGNGCKKCHESRLEREIRVYLTNEHINFETSKKFKWLKRQHLDFYLPEYNVGIECQGEQHFVEVKKFKKTLAEVVEMDRNKNKLCVQNHLRLLYFTDDKVYNKITEKPDFYDKIFVDKVELLERIKGT